MNDRKENVLVSKSFDIAIRIVKLYKYLCEVKSEYVMSKQVLRSGTAVGALVREAQNAESKADFIHKFKIAAKEAEETEYWLLLCQYSENYPFDIELLENIKEIQRIINSILNSAKTNKTNI